MNPLLTVLVWRAEAVLKQAALPAEVVVRENATTSPFLDGVVLAIPTVRKTLEAGTLKAMRAEFQRHRIRVQPCRVAGRRAFRIT